MVVPSLGLLDPQDGGSQVFRNSGNPIPIDTALTHKA